MSFPILTLLGCGTQGVSKPVEDTSSTEPVVLRSYDADYSFLQNALPLVDIRHIDEYEAEMQKFGLLEITNDSRTNASGVVVDFQRYNFHFTYTTRQPVYPIYTCYLYWLHNGQSHPELMGGTASVPGESILVLKPVPSLMWREWQPGKKNSLTESVYLNVDLDEAKIKILIGLSVTQKYHQYVYKKIKGTDAPITDSWVDDYFQLFSENPTVPVIVNAKQSIGSTTEEFISMYFKMSDLWRDHETDVECFFKCHQRYYFLMGHPFICTILARNSIKIETVDIIRCTNDDRGEPLLLRSKKNLVLDFYQLVSADDPEYHPLAINTELFPHQVMVPRIPDDGLLLINDLVTRDHYFVTRLKISNPLHLPVKVGAVDETKLLVSPSQVEDVEKVIELKIAPDVPGYVLDTQLTISVNDEPIHVLDVRFFPFRTISIKFHKLSDVDVNGNMLHEADMNEDVLREILLYANKIIGRQSNTYLVPVADANGKILHQLNYQEELDDIISVDDGRVLAQYVFEHISATQNRKMNILFVWNGRSDMKKYRGITIPTIRYEDPTDTNSTITQTHSCILINTKMPELSPTPLNYSQVVVHELGHWMSHIFSFFPNKGMSLPECSGEHIHFKHPDDECQGGDWNLYSNLMMNGGGWCISSEQAKFINDNADQVLP